MTTSEQPIDTMIPDLTEVSLDQIDLAQLDEDLQRLLADVERPRFNLGGSGPPGRVD